MHFYLIGIVSHLQRMALMAFLPACLPAFLLSQTTASGLLQTIAAGRLTTVAAVFGQLVLQALNGCGLLLNQIFQLLHSSEQYLNQINEVRPICFFQLLTVALARYSHDYPVYVSFLGLSFVFSQNCICIFYQVLGLNSNRMVSTGGNNCVRCSLAG